MGMELGSLFAVMLVISAVHVCQGGYGYGGYGYGGHMKKYGGHGGGYGDYGGHGGGYGGHGGGYGGHGGGYGGHGGGYGGHGGGYGGHGGGYGGHGGGYGGHGGDYGGHGGGYGGHGGGYGGHGGGYGGHGGGYGGHGGGHGGGYGGGHGGGGYGMGHAHYHFYPVYKKKGFGAGGSLLAGLASGLVFGGLLQMPMMAAAAAGRRRRDVPEAAFPAPLKYGTALRKQLAQIDGEQPCQVALQLCDLELAKLMRLGGRAYATHAQEEYANDTSIRDVYEKYLTSSSDVTSGAKGDRPAGHRSELGFIMCSQLLPKCSPYYYPPSESVTSAAATSGSFLYQPFEEEEDDEDTVHRNRNFTFNRTITV